MARLSIEQIKAPDLSVASQATARAGESFREGMSSAQDLLSKYQKGIEANADKELTNLLAGAKNEEEWDKVLSSTDFSQMNISDQMRENILNGRDAVLGYENQRASTGLVNANTGNVNASAARTRGLTQIDANKDSRAGDIHGVDMNDHRFRQGSRDELAGMTGIILNDAVAQDRFGYQNSAFSAAIDRTESGGGADQYDTLYGHRNRENGTRVSQMTLGELRNFASTDGAYGQSVNEEIGRVATPMGKYQIVGTTLRGIQEELNIPDSVQFNPDVQEMMGTYLGQKRVQGTRSREDMRSGLRSEWEGFKNKSDAELDVIIDELRSTPRVTREDIIAAGQGGGPAPRQQVTENPNQGGASRAAVVDSLSNSQFILPDTALGILDGSMARADAGQVDIGVADKEASDEALASQLLEAARNNVDPAEAMVQAQNAGRGATAVEELARQQAIVGAADEGGPLDAARLQIGTTGINSEDAVLANTTLNDIEERQNRDPFQFAQNAAQSYKEDPTTSLRVALEGINIPTTNVDIEAEINKLANKAGISREEAAYSFARAAEINIPLIPDLSFGGDNLAQNRAYDFAMENFASDKAATARSAIAKDNLIVERVQNAAQNLGKIERKIQKLRNQGEVVPTDLLTQQSEAKANLDNLYREHRNSSRNREEESGDPTIDLPSNPSGSSSPGMRNANPQPGWNNYLYQ